MPPSPRLTQAKSQIVGYFDRTSRTAFSFSQISLILEENRDDWRLAQRTTVPKFIEYLTKHSKLSSFKLQSEASTNLERFSWGRASSYDIALSLRNCPCLTHLTAVHLHALTDLIPATMYVRQEYPSEANSSWVKNTARLDLEQEGLDAAFAKPQRVSSQQYTYKGSRYVLLRSPRGTSIGLTEKNGLPVTNIERTLIDIAVRPAYAGGINMVATAYRNAVDQISVRRLVGMLRDLDYAYPYHQSIGFLLDQAGVSQSKLKSLMAMGLKYDFYLAHELRERVFCKKWRLYHPTGLELRGD